MEESVGIRKFSVQDRVDLRRISCETAFVGREKGKIFSDDEILADALTIYFTDYEPQSCFVAVANNKVVGYISGAKDAKAMEQVFNRRILPGLLIKAFRRGVFFNRRNLKFFWYCLISMLKGEFRAPDFSREFPAILHINLDNNSRGQDVGSTLIARFLQYLKEEGISGVHFGTLSEGASIFFAKMGFNQFFKSKRSYLKAYVGKELEYYVFGKKL
jgi:GNAT superfamily N-acetyltransferase